MDLYMQFNVPNYSSNFLKKKTINKETEGVRERKGVV